MSISPPSTMADPLDGTCLVCGEVSPRANMARHLVGCLGDAARATDSTERHRGLLIRVEARFAPHWLYLLAPLSGALTDLDDLLRDLWLECCGHLSEFTIDGTRYAVDAEEFCEFGPPRESMDVPVGEVLESGTAFGHVYDFGTATRLELTCLGPAPAPAGSTRGVARNNPPRPHCETCANPAESVCANCYVHGAGFVCDRHRDTHDCDSPTLLPVVNSPRMGLCRYTGN